MGILALEYISSKSVFFIGATIVSLAVLLYLAKTFHVKPGGGGLGMGPHPDDQYRGKLLQGMAAATVDANPSAIQNRVHMMLTANTSDHNQLMNTIPEITTAIRSALAPGGPLNGLALERANGSITGPVYEQKLNDFIRQLAADHSIPMNEYRVLRTS
jgi:hypothetical protein